MSIIEADREARLRLSRPISYAYTLGVYNCIHPDFWWLNLSYQPITSVSLSNTSHPSSHTTATTHHTLIFMMIAGKHWPWLHSFHQAVQVCNRLQPYGAFTKIQRILLYCVRYKWVINHQYTESRGSKTLKREMDSRKVEGSHYVLHFDSFIPCYWTNHTCTS